MAAAAAAFGAGLNERERKALVHNWMITSTEASTRLKIGSGLLVGTLGAFFLKGALLMSPAWYAVCFGSAFSVLATGKLNL